MSYKDRIARMLEQGVLTEQQAQRLSSSLYGVEEGEFVNISVLREDSLHIFSYPAPQK